MVVDFLNGILYEDVLGTFTLIGFNFGGHGLGRFCFFAPLSQKLLI